MYTEAMESIYSRPYMELWFYPLKVEEEQKQEPCVFMELAASKNSTTKFAKNALKKTG